MDPGTGNAGESLLSLVAVSLGIGRGLLRRAGHLTQPWVARAGEVLDGMPQEGMRPRFDEGRERERPPEASLWASLQPDALGVVLRFLPCGADRARLRSVCRNWRAGSRGHGVPPPLPLLVLPRLRFSGLTPGGALTAARRAWMPDEVAADNARCVGSCDEWLVCGRHVGRSCFLVNAFSHEVIHLPPLSFPDHSIYPSSTPTASGWHFSMPIRKAALSAPPDSQPNWIVVALAFSRSKPELALWKPGMTSWHICREALIAGQIDMVFFRDKLYMLWRFTPCLFALDLKEDNHGVSVSHFNDCLIERRLPKPLGAFSCNIVVWRGNLLLIIRYHGGYRDRNNVTKVEVFTLDFSKNPYGVSEIHSFGGDCIFVGSGGCKSFPASMYSEVEGDLIYFGPDDCDPYDKFVYNMKDGTVRPFPVSLSLVNFGALEDNLDFPVWLFHSE
ncbi:hypothetical protein ACP4OV_028562 [Aristida adscensionis]